MKHAYLIATLLFLVTTFAVTTAYAGHDGGPLAHADTVAARHTDRYEVPVLAGEDAEVLISSYNSADDLDLLVLDQNGNPVCSDYRPVGRFYAKWTPAQSGVYTIRVINCESHAVPYLIGVN